MVIDFCIVQYLNHLQFFMTINNTANKYPRIQILVHWCKYFNTALKWNY